ncbi:MAG: hypothetical protein FJ109_06030 [Deltaproteobacteria bacterium]|nr:hypothetical protein [Deltaproteobacteria bacterium]
MDRRKLPHGALLLGSLLAGLLLSGCAGGTSVTQSLPDGDAALAEVTAEVSAREVGTPETGAELPDSLVPPDVAEVEPGCGPGMGCFLDPCSENPDCQSGWCVEHMGQGLCSRECQDECPEGWLCKQAGAGGPDVVFICVSNYSNLCKPCLSGDSCTSVTGLKDVCVEYGPDGDFCGSACDEATPCPFGYLCKATKSVEGAPVQQCMAQTGTCPCTEWSVSAALATACEVENAFGLCSGFRVCTAEGLAECDAPAPAEESCNDVDDDCDGSVDEDTCDDGSECTVDSCLGEAGCKNEPLNEGECKDGDACTMGDHCEAGVCVGTPILCDDKDPCTDDACDGKGGCKYSFNQASCDDEDPCTVADQCGQGECAGVKVKCDCQQNADCKALEDGDVCNGTLVCSLDELPYECEVASTTVIDCPAPTGIDAICQAATCDPLTGKCGFAPDHEGFACDDGNACTVGDKCVQGKCEAGVSLVCKDDNPCTNDACDPAAGCTHVPNMLLCDDGNVCTTGDTCADGICVGGAPLPCDDGNVCTDDSCDAKVGCLHAANKAECDDANACTLLDFCQGGKCISSGDKNCDDGNVCTKDYCLALKGCVSEPASGPCSDGDACTVGDQCSQGACKPGAAVVCDDANPCTDDGCKGGICVFGPNQAACDDGNVCTAGEACKDGKCVLGKTVDCDDSNLCTDDSCDLLLGCLFSLNSNPCDDGNACTLGDKCNAGACKAGLTASCDDKNPCTDDTCDPAGGCQHTPNTQPCNDGNLCTSGDTCAAGKCVGGETPDCGDGNPCTDDWCDAGKGCQHKANQNPCDDGNECTHKELCADGKCQPGTPAECDDGNVCTTDSCAPATGCSYAPNTEPCDDKNVCTQDDVCGGGACNPGAPKGCEDGNPCTNDLCHPQAGCVYQNNTNPCDDANACTTIGVCAGGICAGSVPPNCDDGNLCTDDTCIPATGCTHAPNSVACNDGNACTTGDKCFAGECKGTGGLTCNDGVVCTTDSCDPDKGCVYTPIVPCCSNGIVEPPEQCDDGNVTPGDGCEANCTKPQWVKVGSYNVISGPAWGSNPPCYTGREACAKVFGGSASQYQGSTDANTINNKAHHSIWGIGGCTVYADDYKKNTYYNCGGSNCSSSAYVNDNCSATNYCWKLQ